MEAEPRACSYIVKLFVRECPRRYTDVRITEPAPWLPSQALQGLVTGVAPSWTCPSATMEGMDVNVMPGDVVVATDGTYKVLQILGACRRVAMVRSPGLFARQSDKLLIIQLT